MLQSSVCWSCSHLEAWLGQKDPLPSHSYGCWQETSVPCDMDLSVWLLKKLQLAFPQSEWFEKERKNKQAGSFSVFYDLWSLESEVVISLFLLYSIGHTTKPDISLEADKQGSEYQEGRSLRSILEAGCYIVIDCFQYLHVWRQPTYV